ncbi:MAG: hypothetical protein U5K56_19430 [Halioglobus sp.]|nr:hypothetical protein [Halioglobus sp.]
MLVHTFLEKVDRSTGSLTDNDLEEELPEDIEAPDLYAEVPNKRDLNLGKPLVLKFAARFMPDTYEEIDEIFRRRGAYARYKDLLYEKGKLEEWYEFEQSSIEKELIDWAQVEGFVVEKDSIETAT